MGVELSKFQDELREFTVWYAIALSRHMADPAKPYKEHPDHVLNPSKYRALTALEPGEDFPDDLYQSVFSQYKFRLRGKSLMNLLIRNTNSRKGLPRHTTSGLIEYVATRPGENLERVAKKVEELIA